MSGGQEFATDRFTPFQALVMEDFKVRVPHSAPQGKPEGMQR